MELFTPMEEPGTCQCMCGIYVGAGRGGGVTPEPLY
jgi:hypothetical protein